MMKICLCLVCCFLIFFMVEPTESEELCVFMADAGPCKGAIIMYAYDPFERKCIEFLYGGCGGNPNRFETEAECSLACNRSGAKFKFPKL